MVDEACDESNKEQMDTTTLTLKNEILKFLHKNNLSIHNIRGQGYDGASNIRGEWNGLQALILKECPYAYYTYAHRLQLALVAASKEVLLIYQFFKQLIAAINIASASSKRIDELHAVHAKNVKDLIASGELETGSGLNQIGTLQRAGDTRWGSHFKSISSFMNMFTSTCEVLKDIKDNGSNYSQRGETGSSYEEITSFKFVFVMHIMREIMSISHQLCQSLQSKTQDIVGATDFVNSAKNLIQELRDDGWDALLEKTKLFCDKHDIIVPDMMSQYVAGRGRFRHQQQSHDINEHHYRYDIFYEAVDKQLKELNSRFNEQMMKLLVLTAALNPKNNYRLFNIGNICELVDKFYPKDFTETEKDLLPYQLKHYQIDINENSEFKNFSSISQLCQVMAQTGKSENHPLVDRLICLVLTLSVLTATNERIFSSMKIIKTKLRSKMDDDFLEDSMMIYIERKITAKFSTDSIIDEFDCIKFWKSKLS